MAVAASAIIDRIRSQLIDDGTTQRWSDAELLRLLSDGERTIIKIDPSASSTRASVLLTSGTLQTLPASGHRLLRVIRNMGVGGSTPGRVVRVTSLDLVDAQDPDWHTLTEVTEIKNFMLDPEDEAIYWVYPPSDGTGYVQINYSKEPTELTATTDTITVGDIYRTPLFDYVMWRAHLKDSEFASNGLAQQYFQAFQLFMQVDKAGMQAQDSYMELSKPNSEVKG